MLDVLKKCFKTEMQSEKWQAKLKQMIPSYGQSLKDNPELCKKTRERTKELLQLNPTEISETV